MIVTAVHTSKAADTKITGKTNLSLDGALLTRVPLIFKPIKKVSSEESFTYSSITGIKAIQKNAFTSWV